MCRDIQFARIHVFPYSSRPGTVAATMPDRVPDSVKTQRNRNLGALSREYAETFRQQFSGSSPDVLWEKQTGGVWSGYTPNYIRVYAVSKSSLANRIIQAKLGKPYKDGMRGEIIQNT
jgi:threonylcarbamoyladenosine tRNA methylthiotransferase MtaB